MREFDEDFDTKKFNLVKYSLLRGIAVDDSVISKLT